MSRARLHHNCIQVANNLSWACPLCGDNRLEVFTEIDDFHQCTVLRLEHRPMTWRTHARVMPPNWLADVSSMPGLSMSSTETHHHPAVAASVMLTDRELRTNRTDITHDHVRRLAHDISDRLLDYAQRHGVPTTFDIENMPRLPSPPPPVNMAVPNNFMRRNFIAAPDRSDPRSLPEIKNIRTLTSPSGRTVVTFDVFVCAAYVAMLRESTYKRGAVVTLNGRDCVISSVNEHAEVFGNVIFRCNAAPIDEALVFEEPKSNPHADAPALPKVIVPHAAPARRILL